VRDFGPGHEVPHVQEGFVAVVPAFPHAVTVVVPLGGRRDDQPAAVLDRCDGIDGSDWPPADQSVIRRGIGTPPSAIEAYSVMLRRCVSLG
jgi:hypothetical protein